ncbi:MAG: PASTA domain-containing protein [Bacteroidota bacterium]|nr:PASTA domain-containing protein [Bacteroidota bacterium]
MDIKKFWKETFGGFVLKNLLIAVGITVVLSWAALIAMDFYTHHGESIIIPDLRGSYVEEAEVILAKKGLHAQVIDSVYVRDKKLGTIIDQIPPVNSSVKSNRPVYLIINSRKVREVALPEISDVSFRQADAMLQSMGLSVSNTEYAPSEYKDLVIDVKFHGKSILPGTRIPEGSSLVLVVGNGLGEAQGLVPSLKGMGLDAGTQAATSASLEIGAVNYDVPPSGGDEDKYIIYRQRPAAGTSVSAGDKIDIYLSKDKARLKEVFDEDKKKEDTDEQFF